MTSKKKYIYALMLLAEKCIMYFDLEHKMPTMDTIHMQNNTIIFLLIENYLNLKPRRSTTK